jgi:hypothetical protein
MATLTQTNTTPDEMQIDDHPPPSQIPTTVVDDCIDTHERLWPPTETVVPYDELPDHRPTQDGLAPYTISFTKPYAPPPKQTDDSAAKTFAFKYIHGTILSQVKQAIGRDRYSKAYTPSPVKPTLLGNAPLPQEKLSTSKSRTELTSKHSWTNRNLSNSLIRATSSAPSSLNGPTYSLGQISLPSDALELTPISETGQAHKNIATSLQPSPRPCPLYISTTKTTLLPPLSQMYTLSSHNLVSIDKCFLGVLRAAVHLFPSVTSTAPKLPGFFRFHNHVVELQYRGRFDHCNRCKDRAAKTPHKSTECPELQKDKCSSCKATGHKRNKCPHPRKPETSKQARKRNPGHFHV